MMPGTRATTAPAREQPRPAFLPPSRPFAEAPASTSPVAGTPRGHDFGQVRVWRGSAAVPVIQPMWDEERVYGHAPERAAEDLPGGEEDRETAAVRKIQSSITALKNERRQHKQAVTADVLRGRARFPPGAKEKAELLKHKGAKEFHEDEFGPHSGFLENLRSRELTTGRIREHVGDVEGLEFRDDAESQQTHVHLDGKKIYTLHRGGTAWYDKRTSDAGRRVLGKHGSDKDYVRDDRGVPTRRYAHGVKDENQFGVLQGGGTLKGRFVTPEPVGVGQDDVMTATQHEQAMLGKAPIVPGARHEVDHMLVMHQEFGSTPQQRGVSLGSTPYPLLSNAARGFADDQRARRLLVDLATVPPPRGDAPNLINYYHQIPGFPRVTPPALYNVNRKGKGGPPTTGSQRFTAEQMAQHFGWSTGKNRELFLRKLKPQNVAAA
ncbi:MAG TPA: hypothetical protein VF263_17105, partial [Longimicrobiaceae bacterium]